MAGLKLSHIYKVYPNGVKAVNDFSMEIADKEFIVFVGPSGCGKSTTLRMIAGLEEITAGRLQIDGKEVNDVEPKDRDIAMVFQNYALYPHLTVYQNMALGLKLRKIEKNEIDRRVAQAAQILDITDYLNRRPKELSGGQRQRVALGRAIVREPKVFLLDEPLSNLDAKLRTTMRAEIAKIHKRVGTTFVYVTHDQTEAMTMGTRIVVMKEGVIQQIDSPLNLYRHPCNKFVAGFIGTPQMNFFDASLAVKGDKVVVHVKGTNQSLTIDRQILVKVHASNFDGRQVIVGIRPEHFCLQDKPSELSLQAEVSHIEELGTECLVYTEICNGCRAVVKAPTGTQLQMGQTVNICMDQHFVHLFDAKSENSIIPQIPTSAQVDCKVEDGVLSIGNYSVELPKHIAVASATLQADIPTTAVSVDGSHKADCVLCEKQDNKNLLHLTLDGQTIFALAENDIAQPKIDIDIRQLTIFSDGKEVVQPLACNKLQATLLGKKVVERNQKNKKITQWQYFLNIVGSQIALPNHMALHIVKAVGQNVFKEELRLEIHPDNMQIDSCGIPAQIDSIVSYGNLQYAICKAQGVEICCKISDELAVGDKIFANPDLDFAKIFEVKREIRIN